MLIPQELQLSPNTNVIKEMNSLKGNISFF